jgi:hypothetical protein
MVARKSRVIFSVSESTLSCAKEQPAGQALFDFMEPVAGGSLHDLHCEPSSIAAYNPLKLRSRLQGIDERADFKPKPFPCNLHNLAKRAFAETENRRHSGRAVIADYPSFDTLAISQFDDNRD